MTIVFKEFFVIIRLKTFLAHQVKKFFQHRHLQPHYFLIIYVGHFIQECLFFLQRADFIRMFFPGNFGKVYI